jgi:hypothetical protein
MNLQQTLDQSAAWHLKQLQMLCPEGTRATIVLRIPGSDDVMILGDEPDTKEALFAAIRAINGVKPRKDSYAPAQMHEAQLQASNIKPNAMVPIGSATVLDTPPAPDDMFANMNAGAIVTHGEVEQR